jgi:hypothetical protein
VARGEDRIGAQQHGEVLSGTVEVTATLRGHDDREWLWSHEFHNEQGKLCALVDVVFAVRPAPPELLGSQA